MQYTYTYNPFKDKRNDRTYRKECIDEMIQMYKKKIMINKNSILNKAIYNSLFCHAYIMLDSNNSVIFKSPDSTSPKPIS